MNHETHPDRPARNSRASRFTITTAITILSLTAACVLAVLIAAQFNLRIDATATGQHSLAPRTRSVLGSLDAPIQIVVSANFESLDDAAAQRTEDLLAALADASPRVGVTRIDTGRPGAVPAYQQLVGEIAARESDKIDAAARAVETALDEAKSVADSMPTLSAQCGRVADAAPDPASRDWRNASSTLDRLTLELTSAVDHAAQLTAVTQGDTTLPQPDAVLQAIAPAADKFTRALTALETHARNPDPSFPQAAVEELNRTGDVAADILQRLAGALDRLRRAPALDALNVARLLRQREAILVVGPQRTVAIAFASLFPKTASSDRAALAFAGEVPIVNAIVAVTSDAQPALILVHAEQQNLLTDRGEPTPPFRGSIGAFADRLAQQQITLSEWPTALDSPMPTRASLGLSGKTPLVWFVLGGPTASAKDGYNRITKLAEATRRLIDNGECILLTINPSDLPSVGEPNPLVAPLTDFGLESDSGRVLVTRVSTPDGPSFTAEHTIRQANIEHPIGAALDALATYLPVATPLAEAGPTPSDTKVWPILTIPASDETWAEARWQSPPPEPDPKRDDVDGPWPVVFAAERHRAPTFPAALPGDTQRLIAVGVSQWYVDRITNARVQLEEAGGRTAAQFPGNRELLDASIAWLSGHDELIAQSPDAREIPRIRSLSSAQLTAIRWFLIAGLPALVLATGAATRLLRR